ncbi:MAG TPA: hypothetical protein VFK68_11865 [Propionibacteriaceae bacterium]|nr:hypothetical protein [Propionibacteriaceae bacterium]
MSVSALDAAVADLRESLGSALLAVDVWDRTTALTMSGLHSPPTTGPVLERLVEDLRGGAGLAGSNLDDYLVLAVSGGHVLIVSAGTATAALYVTEAIRPAGLVMDVAPAVRAVLSAS